MKLKDLLIGLLILLACGYSIYLNLFHPYWSRWDNSDVIDLEGVMGDR